MKISVLNEGFFMHLYLIYTLILSTYSWYIINEFKKACMDLDYISGVGFGEWTILWITHVHLYSYSQSKEITKKCTYHSAKNDITTSENFLDWCLVLDTEWSHHNYDVIWNKKSFALFQILNFLKKLNEFLHIFWFNCSEAFDCQR